jgi:plastocyanin
MRYFFLDFIILMIYISAAGVKAGDITGKINVKGARHDGNAVIYIDKVDGKTFEPPKEHAVMDQKNLTFIPHVLPVLMGTTVDFLNSDDVLHNVFTPNKCAEKFNLGTWPKGKIRSGTFKKPGCIAVMLCNVHPEMESFILVLETPYYAVSEKDGSYIIKNVPAGTYTLMVWHEKFQANPSKISVPEQGVVTLNFVINKKNSSD